MVEAGLPRAACKSSESWPDPPGPAGYGCRAWRRVSAASGWCLGAPQPRFSDLLWCWCHGPRADQGSPLSWSCPPPLRQRNLRAGARWRRSSQAWCQPGEPQRAAAFAAAAAGGSKETPPAAPACRTGCLSGEHRFLEDTRDAAWSAGLPPPGFRLRDRAVPTWNNGRTQAAKIPFRKLKPVCAPMGVEGHLRGSPPPPRLLAVPVLDETARVVDPAPVPASRWETPHPRVPCRHRKRAKTWVRMQRELGERSRLSAAGPLGTRFV